MNKLDRIAENVVDWLDDTSPQFKFVIALLFIGVCAKALSI
jgi:hypothetical protein